MSGRQCITGRQPFWPGARGSHPPGNGPVGRSPEWSNPERWVWAPPLLSHSSVVYGVNPTDPLTFGVVSMLLLTIAFVACAVPGWRAAVVDPLVALRYE